jgi:signal transduction histidine kinase
VDPEQIRTTLACLLRNAVEAAPAEGWASIRLETPSADLIDLVVEDNGSGPPMAKREHLFDPFYSGRSAGRGRGLGLATAWRLARENGGDVHFDRPPDGPTRFTLSLPVTKPQESGNGVRDAGNNLERAEIHKHEACANGLGQSPSIPDPAAPMANS